MGTDVNASFSGSSSATSGLRSDSKSTFGDFIVGSRVQKTVVSPLVWIAIAAGAVIVAVVWLIRR